ncbi:MAG: WD40 repeat domain-containing protein, partial [Planctomycetes bacterium]|nr:WD40 repeat domain-containing protein [Planctomycetota bacterium]
QEDPASRIDRVLARLGGGDLEEREAASKELIEMGVGDRGVFARLETLRDESADPELRGRLEGVIREVDSESARRVRLVPQSWIHGHGQSEPRKLALSGDGKRLVTWGDDRRLVMMAASDLRELGVLGTTEKEVKALCFDPAGVHLAVAEESAVRILEVATGKAVATISQEEVSAICYSRDGERIFVASRKGLHAWNPRTGVRERELTGSCVGDVVVSADGKAIVAQGVDGTVWRWSMSDWEEETLLAGDGDITSKVFPWNIALSPDGRHLAQLRKMSGTGSFSGDLVVWDLTTTLPVERLRMPSDEMGLFGPIRSGRDHFVVGGAFEAPVFAWKDLRKVCSVPDGALGTILAPDDGCLFAAVMGEVRRIEFPSGRVLCAKQPHRGQVSAATFHPDGKKVLTGGFDKLIRVWGIEQGNEIGAFERPKGLPGKIAVSHDLSWVALPSLIGSADDSVTGSVSVYDLAERRVVRSSKVRGEFVVGLCLTANRKVLLGHTDGAVSIVDVENGTVEEPVQGDVVFAFGFAFSGDGRFVARAVTDQFTVEVCEISSGKRVFRCKARVHGPVGLSADGRRLYYINEGRMLAMADVVSGDAIASVELPERVDAIAVDPSGRYVGIVCPTKLVVVHAPSLRPVREHEVANMKNLEFSHDGAQILIQGPSSVLVMRITPER